MSKRSEPRHGSGEGAGRRLRRGLPRPGVVGQRAPGLSCCHVAAPRPQPHLRRDERRAVSGASPALPPAHWRVGTPVRAAPWRAPRPANTLPRLRELAGFFVSRALLWCPLSLGCTAHSPGPSCALGSAPVVRSWDAAPAPSHLTRKSPAAQAAFRRIKIGC